MGQGGIFTGILASRMQQSLDEVYSWNQATSLSVHKQFVTHFISHKVIGQKPSLRQIQKLYATPLLGVITEKHPKALPWLKGACQ